MTFTILKRVFLKDTTAPTRTKHLVYDKVMDKPYQLQIIQYPEDNSVYLLYFDRGGQEITDTFHENIQSALSQAEWEFGVQASDWEDL